LPMIGNLASSTGAVARSRSMAAAGLRKKSWLVKSTGTVMTDLARARDSPLKIGAESPPAIRRLGWLLRASAS
jgi:hypothetical protein